MFREMRRFKQLLPQETAIEILNRNTSGTLALIGDNKLCLYRWKTVFPFC